MRIAHCIGSRCHDFAACHDDATGGPCSWLAVDYEAKLGVCSACPEDLARWKVCDRRTADRVAHDGSSGAPSTG